MPVSSHHLDRSTTEALVTKQWGNHEVILRVEIKQDHSWVPNHWVIEKITNHAHFLIWLWFQIISVWLEIVSFMIWLSIKSSNKLQNVGQVIWKTSFKPYFCIICYKNPVFLLLKTGFRIILGFFTFKNRIYTVFQNREQFHSRLEERSRTAWKLIERWHAIESGTAAVWLEWWWIVLVRHFVCRKVHFLGTADMFTHRVIFLKRCSLRIQSKSHI